MLSFAFFPNRATKTPAAAPCPCRRFEPPEAKGAVSAVTCPPCVLLPRVYLENPKLSVDVEHKRDPNPRG